MGEKECNSMPEMVDYHRNFSKYHLIDDKYLEGNHGCFWDLTDPKECEFILTELRNLERKSLNMFTLTTILQWHDLTDEEYFDSLQCIYEDWDYSNCNIKPEQREREQVPYHPIDEMVKIHEGLVNYKVFENEVENVTTGETYPCKDEESAKRLCTTLNRLDHESLNFYTLCLTVFYNNLSEKELRDSIRLIRKE